MDGDFGLSGEINKIYVYVFLHVYIHEYIDKSVIIFHEYSDDQFAYLYIIHMRLLLV